jgi:2-polyprenyl-6-methoxyphenol hydroxylase-like FAD-dependent oxidoreductase
MVIGGGPAGLLAASQLARHHEVALIDRGTLGATTKYWVTSERRLKLHGLADCICHRAPAVVLGTFLGSHARAAGDFVVVDDRLLLRVLIGRCRDSGVLLAERCSLLNLSWEESHIRADTSRGPYSARLVVDASGGQSPIAATFRLHNLYGFFTVYGALLRNIALRTEDIVLAFVDHLGDPPPILEVVPCGPDSAYCAVFTYTRQLSPPQSLESAFHAHCRKNRFFSVLATTEVAHPKTGAIPIGSNRRRRLPGVISIGEAGLVQPPLLGTAFNEILEYSEALCAHVSAVLSRTDGVPSTPNYRYPVRKRAQDRLQLEMIRFLLRGNVEVFDRLVHVAGTLPEGALYSFCSNEMTSRQLLGTSVRLLPHMLFPANP